jgi:DNA-binding NtrC family response regulator
MPRRLLLVDDDPGVRGTLAEVLALGGYLVRSAESGEAALDLVRTEAHDVALLDMRLPGIDGLETMRAIHELVPDLPVVLITGYGSSELTRQAEREGIPVLLKPFELSSVLDLLDLLCDA